jgi:urease accessory protein
MKTKYPLETNDDQQAETNDVQLIRIVDRPRACPAECQVDDTLVLPFELRRKTRQRVRLQSGRLAGLLLPRGTVLGNGDVLVSDDGRWFQVLAAPEPVSIATVDNPLNLAKIAYHLGNRHVAVQVLEDRLIYLHDHVLDDMVRGLGAVVSIAVQPFEPEEGAYHGGGHHHSHNHTN